GRLWVGRTHRSLFPPPLRGRDREGGQRCSLRAVLNDPPPDRFAVDLPLKGGGKRTPRLARRIFARLTRRLRPQSLAPPRQHLAHHAEVVARGETLGADVELAVLVLAEALRARDDHRADRVRALDVRVVVHLDAARGVRQSEGPGERGEQVLLRLRL